MTQCIGRQGWWDMHSPQIWRPAYMPNAYYLFHTLPWRVSADDPMAATPAPTSGQRGRARGERGAEQVRSRAGSGDGFESWPATQSTVCAGR